MKKNNRAKEKLKQLSGSEDGAKPLRGRRKDWGEPLHPAQNDNRRYPEGRPLRPPDRHSNCGAGEAADHETGGGGVTCRAG